MNNLEVKFREIWKIISNAEYITLCTHTQPDGDTLGCAIALQELIKLNCKNNVDVKISGADYPRNLSFLIKEPISLVNQEYFDKSLKVVVDTSTKKRIFDQRVIPEESLKLDHHPCEEKWLYEIGGDYWPAEGQVITLLVKTLNLKVNNIVLEGLAVAILTDTEFFRERNITSETFDMMSFLMSKGLNYLDLVQKMQMNPNENKLIFNACKDIKTEGIVSWIITDDIIPNDIAKPLVSKLGELVDTEVWIAFMKQENYFRCSIRSKKSFNVSQVAKHFGGGGHFNSAGFVIKEIREVNNAINYINKLA